MNQKTTYEITIAEKLEHMAVPDLRAAIWSRIEAELDRDLPDDDNDNNGPDAPKSPNWISITRRFGTFVLIAAVVTVFLISKKQNKPSINNNHAPASIQQVIPATTPNNNESPPPIGIENNNTAIPVAAETKESPALVRDSFINVPAINTDTLLPEQQKPPPVLPIVVPPIKQDTVPKKSKGFKGISDNDYRISLKKDSVP